MVTDDIKTRVKTAYAFLSTLWPTDVDGGIVLCRRGENGSGLYGSGTSAVDRAGLKELAERSVVLSETEDTWYGVCALGAAAALGKKGSERLVRHVACLWADVDKLPDPLGFLTSLGDWSPSLIVSSGGGPNKVHAYWVLEGGPVDLAGHIDTSQPEEEQRGELQRAQYAMRQLTGRWHAWLVGRAGPGARLDNVSNLDRILRLPGTLNHKGETPGEVRLVAGSGRRLRVGDIKAMLDGEGVQADIKTRHFEHDPARVAAAFARQGTLDEPGAVGTVERLLPRYIGYANEAHDFGDGKIGRDWSGFFLAQQLNDHYVPREVAYEALRRFAVEAKPTDTSGNYDPLTEEWAREKVDGVYDRYPPRGPARRPAGEAEQADDPQDVLAEEPAVEDGAPLLAEVEATLRRYIVFPSDHAAVVATLWVTATHAQPAWEHATRLVIKSPIRRCRKTRLQELLEYLSYDSLSSVNISVAALVRSISQHDPPTLHLDEFDTIFKARRREQTEGAEDLRGIINAGFRRGRPYVRWNMQAREREECPTFCMASLAGIGDLPDTVEDRAIIFHLRRRAKHERVAPFRTRRVAPELRALQARLHAWSRAHLKELREAEPTMPVEDRDADKWESLVAVADLAGCDWPRRAREACRAMCAAAGETATEDATLGERLLRDLREVLGETEAAPTQWLLERLYALEESPWRDLHGRPLDDRGLARLLRLYEVRSTKIHFTHVTTTAHGAQRDVKLRGYWRVKKPGVDLGEAVPLQDVFDRYLPPLSTQVEPVEPSGTTAISPGSWVPRRETTSGT